MPAGVPHGQPAPGMPNLHAQQRNAALEHQLAQRRSRKPNDRNMPEGVEDLVIGDVVQQYKDLRDVERKLDSTMMRKRLDIQDSIHRNVKRHKTMRIWISNTADNQPWQAKGLDENAFDFTTGEDGTYRVKIEGRLLDDDDDETALLNESDDDSENDDEAKEDDAGNAQQVKLPRKRFSHFFKSISVEFDKAKAMPTEAMTQIEWKKQPGAPDFDCLEFERKGDENLNVTIHLVRDEQPERFRLSQALSQTLDAEEADRAEVVMGIWEYVKAMGLQEDEEKRSVRCDDRLRQVSSNQFCFFSRRFTNMLRSLVRTLSSFHRFQSESCRISIRSRPSNYLTQSELIQITTQTPNQPFMISKLRPKTRSE
jgi:SWI/SNF-related matrix-associated actin-dependent regulator of chromatin subfamily D